ncbi:unnamed protein product [Rotaria sp. Silwood2]|nr:unnamed protein product [Rotaria sp. Silwood2]CAF3136674.1 unnamed protein product [Rotaria sp. Silwood2]CAF4239585.1 unnamed protein product [Rotaria sp. Silwood2]
MQLSVVLDLSLTSKTQKLSTKWDKSLSTCSTELNDEVIYDINSFDISSFSNSTTAERKCTFERIVEQGAWNWHIRKLGEQLVYKYLKLKFSNHLDFVSIKWENEDADVNLPYDILLIENGEVRFIEVQTTQSYNQQTIQLTVAQIEEIFEHGKNYSIYRVYLKEKKIEILDDIQWRLKHRQQLACCITKKTLLSDNSFLVDG